MVRSRAPKGGAASTTSIPAPTSGVGTSGVHSCGVKPPSTPPRVPTHVRWDTNIPEAAQPRPLRQREAVEQCRFGLGVEVLSQACSVVIPHLEEEDI